MTGVEFDTESSLSDEPEGFGLQLSRLEHRARRMMSLSKAIFGLHSALHPEEVEAVVVEIATDILGLGEFVLLVQAEAGEDYEIAHCQSDREGPEGQTDTPAEPSSDLESSGFSSPTSSSFLSKPYRVKKLGATLDRWVRVD